MDTIFGHMFLIIRTGFECDACTGPTGYSEPLTMMTLTIPSMMMGIDLYSDLAVRCALPRPGSEVNDLADTMPSENTKDPTPTSICTAVSGGGIKDAVD